MSAHPDTNPALPAHIEETARRSLICHRCGQGVAILGTWPKRRKKLRSDFLDKHRDCPGKE